MQQDATYAHDPRFAALKAKLIRKVHLDLPYVIRFLSRMDRLGRRVCTDQIQQIVDELQIALIQEIGDIVKNRRSVKAC